MPSKAITREGKSVYAYSLNKFQAVDWYRDKGLLCPHCKGEMFPRGGAETTVKLHFVHKTNKCSTKMEHHPEGEDHRQGKQLIYQLIKKVINKTKNSALDVDIEVGLPQCGQNGRIADVAIFYRKEVFCVIECQLSRITADKLIQRIQDYNKEGIESYWVLGKGAKTTENIQSTLKYTNALLFLEEFQETILEADFVEGVLS
ncbi:MAG: hypothetical protein F6K31_31635 [Symploca sp. SIO2G7]|nr:hypothetical protein [Symploca sp. SIO2G7]